MYVVSVRLDIVSLCLIRSLQSLRTPAVDPHAGHRVNRVTVRSQLLQTDPAEPGLRVELVAAARAPTNVNTPADLHSRAG